MERSLRISMPDGSTRLVELRTPVVRIGRRADNDVVLEDAHQGVSRVHAQIVSDGAGPPLVEDLGSANGTLLNGEKIAGPAELSPGDALQIGAWTLIFEDAGPAPGESPRSAVDASERFDVEAAAVQLDELQERDRLLEMAAGPQALPDSGVDLRALELLHEVSVRLARSVTAADVSGTAIDLLFRIEGVQRATLMPWDEERQAFPDASLVARSGKRLGRGETPAGYDPRNLVLSKTILRKVREENRPLHIRDARSLARDGGAMSIMRAGIQAALCSPLTFQGRFLGVLYADNLAAPDAFAPADFRTFTSIAAQAGLAMANAMARETLLKREVERAAMRLYLPRQVADQIAASEGSIELGGVLQPVTVLFADIRGFTQLSEQMDAQAVVQMVNEFFTAMTEVILEAGGTLDKYIGDCVMALFGAPVEGPDDVERGVSAATRMQREVARMNVKRAGLGLCEVKIGVGLHTGPAVVGNIGSAQRMQYTAIGDTVNVAARVASTAAPGQVLVSEPVRAAVPGGESFAPLGEVKLKGREQKVNIYSVPWAMA
jgi:adenylate cyclase